MIGAVGPNLLALSLVRYLLLGLTFFCMYGVARRWIADPRLAALAVLSYAAIYMFGYYAHHDLTHTTALAAAIASSFYAFARLVERPTASRYLMLGVCFGLGILAKWNFVMLALGLPLTCLLHRRFRPLVLDPRVLLALAAMALVVAPARSGCSASSRASAARRPRCSVERPGRGFPSTLAAGTAALARATLAYPMPFLALFLLTLGGALWRARAAARSGRPPADRDARLSRHPDRRGPGAALAADPDRRCRRLHRALDAPGADDPAGLPVRAGRARPARRRGRFAPTSPCSV